MKRKKKEIWKTIPDNENYEVSNLGNVRNVKLKHNLKQVIRETGMHQITLSKDGVIKSYVVEKLMMRLFKPLEDEKLFPRRYTVIHKDGVVDNMDIDNLQWKTVKILYKNKDTTEILPDEYSKLMLMLMNTLETTIKKWYLKYKCDDSTNDEEEIDVWGTI